MLIKRIHLKNIGPHKDVTVEFDKNLHSLSGPMGKGKTFILEAVPACFYGVWPSGGSLYDGVTKGFVGRAEIEIWFEHNGKSYLANRYIDVTKKKTSQKCYVEEFGFVCKIDIDHPLHIAGPSTKEYQQAIINLLGSEELFLSSVFSSQSQQGCLTTASPSERKDILTCMIIPENDKIQEIHKVFKKRENDAQEVKTQAEADLRANERLLNGYSTQGRDIDGIDKEIKDLEDQSVSVKLDIEKLSVERDEIKGALAEYKSSEVMIKGYEDRIKKLVEKIKTYQKRVDSKDSDHKRLVELTQTINSNKVIEDRLSKNKKKLDQLIQKEARYKDLSAHADILKESYFNNKKCQGCSFLKKAIEYREELSTLDLPAQDLVKEMEATINEDSLDMVQTDLDEYESLKKSIAEIDIIEESLGDLKDEFKMKESSIDEERKVMENIGKWVKLSPSENNKNNVITRHQSIQDDLSRRIAKAKELRTIVEASNKLSDSIAKIKVRIENADKNRELYKFISDMHSKKGIPALRIDEAIPILQEIAYGLLQRATNNKFSIEFSTLKKKKDGDYTESLEIICTDEKGARDIREFSGGEQRLLKLVIRLTLSIFMSEKSGIKYQTLFLDEAFESLDAENSENVMTLLEEVSKSEFKRVILVSHKDGLLKDIEGRIDI